MNLARRFATVSGWTLLSRILGLIRDRYAGSLFGDSLALSAFYSAFQLPNLARNLFGEGALSLAFVPRYAALQERSPQIAVAFASRVITRLAVLLGCVLAVSYAVAIAVLFWGGERWALVAALVLPQLPYLWLACLSAQMAGILNAHGRFAMPVAMAVVFNVVFLAALWLGQDVSWLPWAVVIAGVIAFVAHIEALWRVYRTAGLRWTWRWRADQRYRSMRRALGPTIIAGGAQQVAVAVESFLALWLVVPHYAGAVTVLFFAQRLLQFPTALIGNAANVAVYPELARAFATAGIAGQVPLLRAAGQQLAWWLFPASAGLFLVAEPAVRVIYETGAFGDEAVRRTVACAQALALGMLPLAWGRLLVRALHASGDAITPLRLALGVMVVQVIFGVCLVNTELMETGLAIASALANVAMAVVAWYVLRRRGARGLIVWRRCLALLVATAVMAVVVVVLQEFVFVRWHTGDVLSWSQQLWQLLACVIGGGLAYVGVVSLLGVRRRAAIHDRP